MPDLRELAAEVDCALADQVVVVGSMPDNASDLDLLVRRSALPAAESALRDRGFTPWHGSWARLTGAAALVVELLPAEDLALPDRELDLLFAEAAPLAGLRHVTSPSPQHVLLLLARRARSQHGQLDYRRLARARSALVRDPDAFVAAGRRAAAWRCVGSLAIVRARLAGEPLPRRTLAALLETDGGRARSLGRAALQSLRPRPSGALVAVSGLDGAGKSTQTQALASSLRSLGYDVVVQWDRISHGRVLLRLAAPVKAVRRALPRRPSHHGPIGEPFDAADQERAPAGSALSAVWSVVLTSVHVCAVSAADRGHLRRGRVVVRDRYVLDSRVHLYERFGEQAPHAVLGWLLRRLARPATAWYLDVSATEAYRRKSEEFAVTQLAGQRELYVALAPTLDVRIVDGAALPAALHEQLLADVLPTLVSRGVRRS